MKLPCYYSIFFTSQETVNIDQSFDFDRQIEEYYFRKQDMGSFQKMAYGILDVRLVIFVENLIS